jgi:hypothetical protein
MSVLQEWVEDLPLRMQSTLVLGLRGPDGHQYKAIKDIIRWVRGLTFKPGNPANVKVFMGGLPPRIEDRGECYNELMVVSTHFFGHLMHSLEVVGYRHPNVKIKWHAHNLFYDMCLMLHLPFETSDSFEERLKNIEWPGGEQPDNFEEAIQLLGEI